MFCDDSSLLDVVAGEVVAPREQPAGDDERDSGDDTEADQDAVDRAPLDGNDGSRGCGVGRRCDGLVVVR